MEKERNQIKKAEESKFAEQCRKEFAEESVLSANLRKVRILGVGSYLPNVFSASTAGFFVIYILSGYQTGIALFLGALLISVILTVEVGKRGLIQNIAKRYFTAGKASAVAIAALIVCFGLSMTASYVGGEKLVVETASTPSRPDNPQVDSLKNILAAQQATISRLQKTTWKGSITRTASRGIEKAKELQNRIYERIATLEAADDAQYAKLMAKHEAKHLNFGIVLGILAVLSDVFLFGLLWTVKRLRYEVASLGPVTGPVTVQSNGNITAPNWDSNGAINNAVTKRNSIRAFTRNVTPPKAVHTPVTADNDPKRYAEALRQQIKTAKSRLRIYNHKRRNGNVTEETYQRNVKKWTEKLQEAEELLAEVV